jgi:tripartite motif-containing protein 71
MRQRGPATAAAIAALLALTASPAVAAPCPGATNCPYVESAVIGNQGEGTLRFPQAIARDRAGRFYVGDVFTHKIQVFNPDGTFATEWGSDGTAAGQLGSVGGIAVGPNNEVYVADSNNRIERFALDGTYLGSFGSSGSAVGQFDFGAANNHASPSGGGVSVTSQYVFVADTRNNRVQRFSLDGSNPLVIGAGQLAQPQGLAAVGNDRVIVADDDNHRLALFDNGGRLIRTFGNGPGNLPGELNFPYDVAVDGKGNLYVADDLNHRIVRFGPLPKHAYLAFWGGFGTAIGRLEYPRALTADLAGNTYVTDTANNRIQIFGPNGLTLRPPFGLNGRGPGQFTEPQGIGIDPSGLRAVADSIDGRIEIFNPDGSLAAQWGAPAPGPTLLQDPVGIAFDAAGDGYVVDQSTSKVIEFNRAGAIVRQLGGRGAGPGQMQAPSAIALDAAGNIYIADEGNGRISRIAADGTPLPSIGTFTDISSIAVTPDGSRIYGADSATNRVTVLDATGKQIAIYGGQGKAAGHFLTLGAISLDPLGNLWATERAGNRIQELNPVTGKGILSFGQRGTDTGQFIHPNGIGVGCDGLLTISDTGANRVQTFLLAAPPVITACAALPPVSSTPNIQVIPGPPDPAAQLTFALVHKLGILRSRGFSATARCDQSCKLSVTGTLTPLATPRKHHKRVVVKLKTVTRALLPGMKQTLRLPLTALQARSLVGGLGKTKQMKLTLQETATVTAADAEPTILTQTLFVSR